MLVEFGKAGWIQKARQQPDKVLQVLEKVKTDGLLPTLDAVLSKLDQPLPLGYCNVGTVLDVGPGVVGFSKGDRVISNGKHAEVVSVPVNLAAAVPDGVTDDDAAFTVLGAIALQGVRLANPTIGEAFVVTGLGLVGLLAVQLLRANGCRVLGIDFSPERLALAESFGAETICLRGGQDPVAAAEGFSRGRGVDGVVITAATTSNEPLHQAAQMCRKRGRLVLVGVAGLELSRADFYEKELSFQVSCSYGPGRYDPSYEEKGNDYPVGYVRWTEQRNFEAILDLMANRRLDVQPLVSHRFAIDEATNAYDLISGRTSSLGVLLKYPSEDETSDRELRRHVVEVSPVFREIQKGKVPSIAFIGSGNYATRILIPAFKQTSASLNTVVSNGGVSGVHAAKKFGIARASTSSRDVFADGSIDTVVISTRHDSHANLVCDAIAAGKHVFVEKPFALRLEEVEKIRDAYNAAFSKAPLPCVMVGFNRRFAPHIRKISSLLQTVSEPKAFVVTVNAGAIPEDHWTQDPETGGGRIIGEACHFIDLLRFLADSPIAAVQTSWMASKSKDSATISLSFEDGSLGTIHYLANGSKAFPKERLEVFTQGRILQMDNFRRLTAYGWRGFKGLNLWRQDKGQQACCAAFVESISNGSEAPIPFDQIIEVAEWSIEAAVSA